MFTPDEVESLNAYQHANAFHPFTCGKNRTDEKHLDGEGILVATENGWVCPYCDYKQDWAHDFMKNWVWKYGKLRSGDKTCQEPRKTSP